MVESLRYVPLSAQDSGFSFEGSACKVSGLGLRESHVLNLDFGMKSTQLSLVGSHGMLS